MENLVEIASRVERKLNEQTAEFNLLRDRLMIVCGYSIAILTMVFTHWDKYKSPFTFVLTGAVLISLVSVGFLVYAGFIIPVNRGMNSEKIEELIDNDNKDGEFFLTDISYNLDSFKENAPKLKGLQKKLNWGITAQAFVTFMIGISTYFNIL
jgi:hypothetical protein